MEIVMLKHFAAGTLGVAILCGAIGSTAAAGKDRHHWIDQYPSPDAYSYGVQSPRYVGRTGKPQPNIRLDFETESVWRNLRPEWFD
jgi:hypothetical protein